jgi:hypothetical protein
MLAWLPPHPFAPRPNCYRSRPLSLVVEQPTLGKRVNPLDTYYFGLVAYGSSLARAQWRCYNSHAQKPGDRVALRVCGSIDEERCQSGRLGTTGNREYRKIPRVRIPPSPSVVVARSCAREVGNPARSGRKQRYRYHPCAAGKPSYHQ